MKIFDFNNPKHVLILKEELVKLKQIIIESSRYNEDDIWSSMTDKERKEAILSVPNGSLVADKYASVTDWNAIPDNIGDRINLSKYQLASDDRVMGAVMLRGIDGMKWEYRNDLEKAAAFEKLIDGFCKKLGKTYDQLNVQDATNLNRKVAQLQREFKPAPNYKPGGDASEYYGKGPGNWTGD